MYSCKPIRLKSSHMSSPKEFTPVAKQIHRLKNSQDLNLKASTPRDLLKHIKSAIFKHCTSLPNVTIFLQAVSTSAEVQLPKCTTSASSQPNTNEAQILLDSTVILHRYHQNRWRRPSGFIPDTPSNLTPQCHGPWTRGTTFILNSPKTEQKLQPSARELLWFYYKVFLTPATCPLFSLKEVGQQDLNFARTSSSSPLLTTDFPKIMANKPLIFYNTLPQGAQSYS